MPEVKGLRPLGLYYGWWVMGSLMLCAMVVYGAGLYGFTLFVLPLSEEFGWSPASTAGLVSIFWLSAPLSLFIGPLYYRFGAMKLICVGVVIEAICLISLGFCNELWQMYLLRALMGVGKVLLVANIPIVAARWFSHRFGFANACGFAGLHLGGLVMAPLTHQLIEWMGWREACLALSALIVIVGLPPVLTFLRVEGPEHFGVGPDGLPLATTDSAAEPDAPASAAGATTWFVRSASFWLFVLALFLTVIAYAGLLTNYAVIAKGIGLPADLSADAVGLLAGAAFIGALSGGYLADRFSFKRAIVADMALMALGVAVTAGPAFGLPLFLVLPAAAIFGLACGGMDAMTSVFVRQRFSGPALPYVFGATYFAGLAFLFVDSILIGFVIDRTPGVLYPLAVMAAAPILAAIAYFLACTRKPEQANEA